MPQSQNRKLAAILFADIVGYTALMQKDEQTASNLLRHFQQQLEEKVTAFNGRIVNFYGDGALCMFQIPIDAVRCAMALQTTFNTSPKTPVRIGIHSGTVTLEGDKIFGDSVNITSRIESMGIAGGILLSKKVRDEVKNNPDLTMIALGSFEFKNVEEPMEIFALANEGFAVPKGSDLAGKFKPSTQTTSLKWLNIAAGIFALLIAGYFLMQHQQRTVQPNAQKSSQGISIGVLPFKNLSQESSLNYFNIGIQEDLVTQLIRIKELNVYSTEAANQYKSSSKTPIEIGREMKVEYVLEGASRMENQQKIVSPKLLHVPSGKYIWGASFREGELPVASFQNEIAKLVATNLQLELSPQQQQSLNTLPTKNEAAYDLYLRSFDLSNYQVEPAKEGIKLLGQAIQLDPTFSKAYAKLSSFYWMLADQSTDPSLPNWKKSKQMAEKAIFLDPENADGWANLGITQTSFDWDLMAAEKSFLKALELNPKERIDYSVYLLKIHQSQQAIKELLLGIELAPELKTIYDEFLVVAYAHNNQFNEAKALIDKYEMDYTLEYVPLWAASQYYARIKDFENGVRVAKLMKSVNPYHSVYSMGYYYGKLGNHQAAQNCLDSLKQIATNQFISPTLYATIYLGLGEKDIAYQAFQDAYDLHDGMLMSIPFSPAFPEIQEDDRYSELLDQMGFPKNVKN